MGEHAQAVEEADAQHRREQRAGEPEHDQKRGDVAHQQVLDHVHVQQLVAELADGGEQGDQDHREAAVEAHLAPRGDPVLASRERACAPCVEQTERQRGEELDDVLGGENGRESWGDHPRSLVRGVVRGRRGGAAYANGRDESCGTHRRDRESPHAAGREPAQMVRLQPRAKPAGRGRGCHGTSYAHEDSVEHDARAGARSRARYEDRANSRRNSRKTFRMSRKMPAASGIASSPPARRRRLKSTTV